MRISSYKKHCFYTFPSYIFITGLRRIVKTNERILSAKKIYAADTGIRNLFSGFQDKGSLFENYVYLRLRKQNPSYIYENKTEIDFYLPNKTIIEVKYHNQALSPSQEKLLTSYPAKKRKIIRNESDLVGY